MSVQLAKNVLKVLNTVNDHIETEISDAGKEITFLLYDMWQEKEKEEKMNTVFGEGIYSSTHSFQDMVNSLCTHIEEVLHVTFNNYSFHYYPVEFHIWAEDPYFICPAIVNCNTGQNDKERIEHFINIINQYVLAVTEMTTTKEYDDEKVSIIVTGGPATINDIKALLANAGYQDAIVNSPIQFMNLNNIQKTETFDIFESFTNTDMEKLINKENKKVFKPPDHK